MHCTPISTPGVAFTLTQSEHALFYSMLPYIRDPTKQYSTKDANGIADGLRKVAQDSEFAKMTVAYRKFADTMRALHNRGLERLTHTPPPGKPLADAITNLTSAIKDYASERLRVTEL
jgi:hypothetical protein